MNTLYKMTDDHVTGGSEVILSVFKRVHFMDKVKVDVKLTKEINRFMGFSVHSTKGNLEVVHSIVTVDLGSTTADGQLFPA